MVAARKACLPTRLRPLNRNGVKWEAALDSGKLLKPETLAAMWSPSPASVRTSGPLGRGMGLRWTVASSSGHRTAFSNGGDAALYLRFPDDRLTIVVLTNCHGAKTGSLADGLATHYAPEIARYSPFSER